MSPSAYYVNFYEIQLAVLASICGVALLVDRYVSKSKAQHKANASADERLESGKAGHSEGALSALTRKYLLVYAIVMGACCCYRQERVTEVLVGADWLQGPYVYSLYREQYEFPERLVAVLFVTGFVSAGFAAPLVGVWADQQ